METGANQAAKMPSDRSFGLFVAGFCLVLAFWPLLHHLPPRWLFLALAAALLLVSYVSPAWLHPLNFLWFRLGLLLHSIVSPVVMALLFFLVVTPIGLVMRAFGNDPLRLKPKRGAKSFWIDRDTDGTDLGLQS
jgi:hypothetical protein